MRNNGESPPSNSRHHSSRSNSNHPSHRNLSHPYYQSHQYYGSSGTSSRQAYRNEFGNDVEENYEEERSKKDLRSRLDELKKSKDKSGSSAEVKSKLEELELRASLQSAYYRQNQEIASASKNSSSSHRHSGTKSSDRDESTSTKRLKPSNETTSRSSSSSHKRSNESPDGQKRTKIASTATAVSPKSKSEEKSRKNTMINDAEVSEIVSDEEKSDESSDESKQVKRKREKSSSQDKEKSNDQNVDNDDGSKSSSASNSQEKDESLVNSERSDDPMKATKKSELSENASSHSASRSRTRSNSISDYDQSVNRLDEASNGPSRSGSSGTYSRTRKQSDESEQSNSVSSDHEEEDQDQYKKKGKPKRRQSNSDKSVNSDETQSEHTETDEENRTSPNELKRMRKSKIKHHKSQHHKNRVHQHQHDPKKENRRRSSNSSEDLVKDNKDENFEEPNDNGEMNKTAIVVPEVITYHCAIQGCRSVEEFECLNKIEEGAYGVVYRAKDKKTHEIVALKRLKMEKEKEGFPITSIREVDTLLKAQHPNVVTVREIVVGSNMDKIYMVMDYVEHDLKSLMNYGMKKPFLMSEVKTLMQQLLSGIAHLHDNWIIHRDLKTSNLLLSHKGVLKIADFGLAREYGSPLKEYTPIVVTLWYRCPELLLNTKKYSTSVDMWSVGCIFGELMTMKALFPGKNEKDQLDKIFKDLGTPTDKIWPGFKDLPLAGKLQFAQFPYNTLRSRFGNYLSDKGFDLINKLLTYDPARRMPAEEALKSEFFKESPLPIDATIFPTWPAKSEGFNKNKVTKDSEPRAPSPGKMYEQLLGDVEDGFVLQPNPIATGFTLR